MLRDARWLGVAASLAWIVAAALLAARGDIGIAVWRLYCYFAVDTNCGETVYVVVHWPVIAIVMLVPVILGWLLGWGIFALRRRRGA
jgi:hypothetical protein